MTVERYPPGSVIAGRYRVASRIGEGAMGEVLRVEDLLMEGAPLALKIVDRRLHAEAGVVRLQNEALLAAKLRHPNIVSIFENGRDEYGHAWIAMELVEGEGLDRRLKRGALQLSEALCLTLQIASALKAAHMAGIVHRDLKPANVLITSGNEIKVADFGLAKSLDYDLRLTLSGELPGTLCYAAPEQAAGGADPRMDIYAIGILFYELLSGEVPFYCPDPVTLQRMHREKAMPHINKVMPTVPVWVDGIIQKCTQKSPPRRFSCMQELIDAMLANAHGLLQELPAFMRTPGWLLFA